MNRPTSAVKKRTREKSTSDSAHDPGEDLQVVHEEQRKVGAHGQEQEEEVESGGARSHQCQPPGTLQPSTGKLAADSVTSKGRSPRPKISPPEDPSIRMAPTRREDSTKPEERINSDQKVDSKSTRGTAPHPPNSPGTPQEEDQVAESRRQHRDQVRTYTAVGQRSSRKGRRVSGEHQNSPTTSHAE